MAEGKRRLVESAQPYIPEPVLAAGIFSRPGAPGGSRRSPLSSFGGMLRRRRTATEAGGLPRTVLLAVTADNLFAFSFKPRWRKLQITGLAAKWDRDGLMVGTEERGTSTRVVLEWPALAARVELDANRPDRYGVNAEVLRLLQPPA